MIFTQQTAEDLLTIWQELDILSRDKFIGDVLFPLEYSEKNPPRFSQNLKNDIDTNKLALKIGEFGLGPLNSESLPRSSLSSTRCGNVIISPMPAHKAIAFVGYCLAASKGDE